MKTITLLTFLILGLSTSAQTIRIADNNSTRPTGANIYATIQAAVNAALPGDLVYVQPSPTSYGGVTIDRPITLRGIGFNTGKDIALSSTVGDIVLTNTVSNSTNASGTNLEGLVANNIYMGFKTGTFSFTFTNITISNCSVAFIYHGSGYMPASNITIQNCSIYYLYFHESTVSQLLVYGNLVTGGLVFGTWNQASGSPVGCCSSFGGSMSSVIFSNNIVTQTTTNQFFSTISAMAITNNVFIAGTDKPGSRFISGQLTDATVTNNIFYGTTPGSSGSPFERNSFLNNISFGTSNDALPPPGSGVGNTGSGNQVSIDPKFVNAIYGAAYLATMDFTLQAGSPAKNAGTDGTDIGITGGAYPATTNFSLKTPHAPVIMTLNPAAIVPQGQPIQTNIKAKSN